MLEPDGEIDERAVRHNLKRFFILYVVLIVAGGLTGGLIEVLAPHHHRVQHHHHGSVVGGIAAIVVGLIAIAVGVATLYAIFHRRSYRRVWQYSWSRRRRVFRALRKGREIPAEDRPVADAMMYLNRNWRRNLLIILPLLILIMVFNGLLHSGSWRWFWIGLGVLYVGLIPFSLWNQHRIERNYHRMVRSGPPPAPAD